MMEYPGTPLAQGSKGPMVVAIQERLGMTPTGEFGPKTEELVTAFQKAHGLLLTGVVGPKTWAALFAPVPEPDLGEEALQFAETQVGVTEKPLGSNRGPEVDLYLRSIGLDPGNPWCLAFVYYCVDEAAKSLGRPNPLLRTGSCSALYAWAKQKGLLVPKPATGDIFLCIGGETGHYHTGFVAGQIVLERFPTIEGNSNEDGSANGIAVVKRPKGRLLASCHYVRL